MKKLIYRGNRLKEEGKHEAGSMYKRKRGRDGGKEARSRTVSLFQEDPVTMVINP